MSRSATAQTHRSLQLLLLSSVPHVVLCIRCRCLPVSCVQTQLQLQARGLTPGQPLKYSGVFDCAYKIVKERGPLALYKGVSTLIVVSEQTVSALCCHCCSSDRDEFCCFCVVQGSIPKAAVRFAAFAQMRQLLSDPDGRMSHSRNLLAGLGAGVAEAVIAVTPTEAIKTRLIADQNLPQPRYRGLIHGTTLMLREEGVRAVYAGLLPTVLKQSGNQAVRFTAYELMKTQWSARRQWDATAAMACGMTAGGLSVFVTMPFDVVKTQMQGLDAGRYSSTVDCVRKVWREDGLLAFWRGTTPRLGRVMCSGGITFTAYEIAMKQILQVWPDVR
jgi:solute carrier family 25 citrate transporter 1